jgi:predicted RNase H-like HicB family nuclease
MDKQWYTSKTLWVNGLAFIAMLVQSQTGVIMDAELQIAILAVINLVLRLVTKKEINWKNSSTGALIILMAAVFSFSMITMPGCATKGTTGTEATDEAAQWDQTAVKAYQLTGLSIQTAQALLPTAKSFLSESDYATLDTLINTTVPVVYDAVGVALEAVIGVRDTAEREGAIAAYEAALAQLTPLMTKVSAAIEAIRALQEQQQ